MGRQIILTKEQEEKIIYNYTILHYGQKKSGAFIPVSDSVVRRVLKKYNIPIKSIQETNVNKLWVKHDYFQTQSPDMGYWLGILGSDGSVNAKENQIYIELQRQDRELLEKLNLTIENERPVKDYETGCGYKNSKLYFYSKQIKQDLAKYHIVPNKTYSKDYGFPELLNPKYYKDYIRGLFDGDGSIKITGYSITWQVDVGTIDIAYEIQRIFKTNQIDVEISFLHKKNVTIYRIYGYGKEKCQKIYNWLYNTSSSLWLERKKKKFEELLK